MNIFGGMSFNNIAVLIHGFTLLNLGLLKSRAELGNRWWYNVVWGDPEKKLMGRVPYGVLMALTQKAMRVVFSTGATCLHNGLPIARKDWVARGKPEGVVWEADYTYNYLMKNFNQLLKFPELKNAIKNFQYKGMSGIAAAKKYIADIHIIENQSANTTEEIWNILMRCGDMPQLEGIIRISNPSHEARCTDTARKAFAAYSGNIKYIFSIPCQSDWAEGETTLVFEPYSGSGEKRRYSPCKILSRYFALPSPELQDEFLIWAEHKFKELMSK